MSRGLREKREAPDFVSKMLWPDFTALSAKLSEGAKKILATENESLSISRFWVDDKEVPQAMPFLVRDKDSMEALFRDGAKLDGENQVMVVKSFQVTKSRFFCSLISSGLVASRESRL